MKIHFVRHGESHANIQHKISNRGLSYGLTLKGRQQAYQLAEKLKKTSAVHIYCSPLLRAIETGVILANRMDLDYEVVDALREYDCGLIEGASDAGAWKAWQELFDAWKLHQRWEQRIEGGESFYDLRDRFAPFIEGLVKQDGETDKEFICVSHGGVYRLMLSLVIKNVNDDLINGMKMDYTTHIVVEKRKNGLYCTDWNGVKPALED